MCTYWLCGTIPIGTLSPMSRGLGTTQRILLTELRTRIKNHIDTFEGSYYNRREHSGWWPTQVLADAVERSPRQILRAMASLESRGLVESAHLTVDWIGAGEIGRKDYKGEKMGMPVSGKCYRALLPHGESLTEYCPYLGCGTCQDQVERGEHVMQRIRDYYAAVEEGQDAYWPTPILTDEWVNEYAPRLL